jgi:2-polyprenyl-3-methyl-5-hydroxy-6-metoxy-1,4-benzoquinol methylase
MRFNIYHVKINEFYHLYEDLIQSLAASLNDLGHSCTVKQNVFAADAVNILLGSTIFASRYHGLPAALQDRPYIVYQLECLDDDRGLLKEWPEYWQLLQDASAIWDYAPASAAYLRGKGLQHVYDVPPAFHRNLESFRPKQNPDIDVLFFGSPHDRRHRIIAALQGRGIGVVHLHGVFGEARNRYISRAKILLNLHAWDELNCLETVRLSFLLANRAFVISEASDHDPYDGAVVYAPYDKLVDVCAEYLGQPAEARDKIAENGYLAVRKLDLVGILRHTLAEMGQARLERLVSEGGWVTEAYYSYSQTRNDVVGLVPPDARRILDIGCANGLLGASIKQRQTCHVTGVEIFADAAVQATRFLDLAICGDALDVLPSLADGDYDCVLMLDILEHVSDTAGILRLASRKLADDGVLVLSVANVGHWSVVQGLLEGRWDEADQGALERRQVRFFTLGSLRRALDDAGLRVVDDRSTQIANALPSAALTELFERSAGPGGAAMHTSNFLLACRKT